MAIAGFGDMDKLIHPSISIMLSRHFRGHPDIKKGEDIRFYTRQDLMSCDIEAAIVKGGITYHVKLGAPFGDIDKWASDACDKFAEFLSSNWPQNFYFYGIYVPE